MISLKSIYVNINQYPHRHTQAPSHHALEEAAFQCLIQKSYSTYALEKGNSQCYRNYQQFINCLLGNLLYIIIIIKRIILR